MLFSFSALLVLFSVSIVELRPVENPILTAGYFEGDMRLTEAQKNRFTNVMTISNRNVVDYLWPGKTVSFIITGKFQNNELKIMKEAMDYISSKTCIRFKQVTKSTKQRLEIKNDGSGCWSDVGYLKKPQRLNLGNGCIYKGVIVHELLHTLGFYHQQSASNRDDYVRIHLENVEREKWHNFNKYPSNVVNDYGVGYDYDSIMHYGAMDFSKNDKPSIEVLKKPPPVIGQRDGLSQKDILKIQKAYKC